LNSTEGEHATHLARAIFDEVVVPVSKARRTSNAPPYFPLTPDRTAETYFGGPTLSVMSAADFELPLGETTGDLLDALATYWTKQGDSDLIAMLPRLKDFARALDEEAADDDGTVDVLCYTLF
jgi:hypothetical protein